MRLLFVSLIVMGAAGGMAHAQDRRACPATELAWLRESRAAATEARQQSEAVQTRLADLQRSMDAVLPTNDLTGECDAIGGASDVVCLDRVQMRQRRTASQEFGRWLGEEWRVHPTDATEYRTWLLQGIGALLALRAEIARQGLLALDREEAALTTERRLLLAMPYGCE